MPFEISVTRTFCASHQLRLYDGQLEPLHGHNWRITVTVAAPQLDAIGVVMDFHELERRLDGLISKLHNRHLNDTTAFRELNPSAENVAQHVAEGLTLPNPVVLVSVQVWETDDCSATYRRTTS